MTRLQPFLIAGAAAPAIAAMIRRPIRNSRCPRCRSLNSYVRPVCVPSQGAVWHWRHRETDPRAVCPCTSSDQSEAEQRPGPSAESLPGDDPSVWQTEHQAGETLCQLVSQNTSGTRLDLCFAPYLSHLAWWEVIVMWLGANSSLIWKKLILLCYCHYEIELTHSSRDFFCHPPAFYMFHFLIHSCCFCFIFLLTSICLVCASG